MFICLTSKSHASSIGQLITVLVIFAIVLAITYFTTKYIANFQKNKCDGANVVILETTRIAQNKCIQIVKIGDRYFALAICKDTVTTISELDGSTLNFDSPVKEKVSFKEFFDKAREEKKDN